jgi:1D-myo-inositol 3-kinase
VRPAAARPAVLVAGHVTLDAYGDAFAPGGSAYYAARTYLGLGAEVRVATAASDDFPPGALEGAEVHLARAARTTTFENAPAAGGGRTQRVSSVAQRLEPAPLPTAWLAPDLLHLAPVVAEVPLAAWVRAARARFVGIGVQGWVRAVSPDGTVEQPRWEPTAAELAGVDAACVGEDDLRGQGGDLVERLAAAIPVVAFTQGERGCELFVRGQRAHVGTFPTREVDPTGAGDAFAAGFFLALARGAGPLDAARLGSAAASLVVEARAGDALGRVGAEAAVRANAIPASPLRAP